MKEFDTLSEVVHNSEKVIDFIGKLILSIASGKGSLVDDKSLRDLVEHIENGGKTNNITIPYTELKQFTDVLKRNKISYITLDIDSDKIKNNEVMVVFKDTDAKEVQVILEDYKRQLDGLCHELDYDTFTNANSEKGFFKLDNITKEELYVFREEAVKYNMDFTVVPVKDKFMIYSNHKEYMKETVTDMLYRTSGADGHDYVNRISKFEKNQDTSFVELKKIAQQPNSTYIIDADNPSRIIELGNKGYSTHLIQLVEDELTGKQLAFDKSYKEVKVVNESLMAEINSMSNPVIAHRDTIASFIEGKSQGKLIISDKINDRSYLEKLRDDLSNVKKGNIPVSVAKPVHNRDNIMQDGNLRLYTNFPYIVLREIEKQNLSGVYIKGKDIAYHAELEPQIQKIFDKYLYKDVEPLTKLERELKYKGRGEINFKDISQGETYYIIDAASPGEVRMEVGRDSYNMIIGADHQLTKSMDSPDYEDSIINFVEAMAIPVVLTNDEFQDISARNDIIKSKVMKPEDNVAVQYIQRMNEKEKEELDVFVNMSKDELEDINLTEIQKEVISRRSSYEVKYEEPKEKTHTRKKEKEKGKRREEEIER